MNSPELRPLQNEEDYRRAMAEISSYFDQEPEPGTAGGDRFELLLNLVESYEAKRTSVNEAAQVTWPEIVMNHQGLPDLPAFEFNRDSLLPVPDDPLA